MRSQNRKSKDVHVTVIVVCAVLSALSVVRAQNGTQPASKVLPLRPLAPLSTVPNPVVPELNAYVADNASAIQLGKTLFWDMQAGSDGVQACATCHFNAGADSRVVNQVSPGLKAGDSTFQLGVAKIDGTLGPNYALHAGSPGAGFGGYHDGDWPLHKQGNVDNRNQPLSDVNDVISSQGVFSSQFDSMILGPENCRVKKGGCGSSVDVTTITSDQVYSFPDPNDATKAINTRRVEPRNTPSVVNAVFNYRNFWDGRAQNICNGANPFGERDPSTHFFVAVDKKTQPVSTLVRLQNSALCSQALGPALSSFEMSADGRNFKELGRKLLSVSPLQSTTTALGKQAVDPNDSVLGQIVTAKKGIKPTYEALIKAAFRPQWWQSSWHVCIAPDGSETLIQPKVTPACPANNTEYTQMQYNFSVFWGIAIQMYESTLRADQTPLDKHLALQNGYTIHGNDTQNVFTFNLNPGVDPYTLSVYVLDPTLDASDQTIFAFDDGNGNISGVGVTQGTVNYSTGAVSIRFDVPPNSAYPVKVNYNTGATPMTQAQLRGLLTFQTKGRCITCHGGPELTNAAVGNVAERPLERMMMGDLSVRVYDNGFYHIGARPAAEDASLGAGDGITGAPLSEAAYQQQKVCNDPSITIMIPGRLGEFIFPAPLSCWDDIGSNGSMKTPGLRNVALTAPYMHNGGQLTLEQVVEFYNRGGDFPDGPEQFAVIDPNIVPLGLTLQEKTDLVDFLRNALTDPRTVAQQAPFDHPQIFVPNGHPMNPNGYPVVNDPAHPGQATDQPFPMFMIPAVGKKGGPPLNTFLQNLAP